MELTELIIRILCDLRPGKKLDGAYLFCQTQDNQDAVFASAERLYQNQRIRHILISKSPAQSGYPGYQIWRAALIQTGIDPKDIICVDFEPGGTLNTLTEAQAMVCFAKQAAYRSLYVTAPPFHLVRAFMTAVTATLQLYPQLALYSSPGKTLPWEKEVAHSQGTTQGSRKDLIAAEFERIHKYQKKGDLDETTAVLKYLTRRDQVTPCYDP
jgi:hypothetical protein